MATIRDEQIAKMLVAAKYDAENQMSQRYKSEAEDQVSILTELQSLRSQAGANEAVAWHGPYGWLTGNIGLNEEYWTVEADEVKDGEFFSIPLYAKEDPFALTVALQGETK